MQVGTVIMKKAVCVWGAFLNLICIHSIEMKPATTGIWRGLLWMKVHNKLYCSNFAGNGGVFYVRRFSSLATLKYIRLLSFKTWLTTGKCYGSRRSDSYNGNRNSHSQQHCWYIALVMLCNQCMCQSDHCFWTRSLDWSSLPPVLFNLWWRNRLPSNDPK